MEYKGCPFCRSRKSMWKAGVRVSARGERKQQFKCQHCHRQTIRPRKASRRGDG